MLSDDPRIPLKVFMGRMATVSLVRQDGSPRYFNGYVTEFRFLRSEGGFALHQTSITISAMATPAANRMV